MWTDDPLADFHSYDARQSDSLSRCPICDCCNEPIQDDYYFETDEGIYCDDCFDDEVLWKIKDEHRKWIWDE